jgi:hypothetical protein
MESTYILTAEMDDDSFAWLDDLRRRHFPPERNFLPAHLTMFHRLSVAQKSRLYELNLPGSLMTILFDAPLALGTGVAIRVTSIPLEQLRVAAKAAMSGELSRQDSQRWRPHVTIQNKVSPDVARQLHQSLADQFTPRIGAVTGLLVWEYLGPAWRFSDRLPFATQCEAP